MDNREKFISLIFIAICAIFILVIWKTSAYMKTEMEEVHVKNKKECVKLNPRYEQRLTAKDGFFKGVEMVALKLGEETVEVGYGLYNKEHTGRFLCGDLTPL